MPPLPERSTLRRLVRATGMVAPPAAFDESRGERLDAADVELAFDEGLAPLLGARLERDDELHVDSVGRARLVAAHRECVAHNVLREHQAVGLFRAFDAARVPLVLLKGAALVRWAYPDFGARSMGDIDVLVPATHWERALGAARAAGAREDGRPCTARLDYAVQLLFGDVRVDLHRALTVGPMFSVDYDDVFERSVTADGRAVQCPEHTFVSLAIHAAKHGFVLHLRGVVDGYAVLASGVSVEAVEATATAWSARRATARWLELLDLVAPLPGPWAALRHRLLRGRRFASSLPLSAPRSRDGHLWSPPRELWKERLLSLDSPIRCAATVADRARLRAANLIAEYFAQVGERS